MHRLRLLSTGAIFGLLVASTLIPPTLAQAEEEVVHQAAFDVRAGGSLQVDVEDMDLDLRPGDAKRLEVEIVLRSRDMEWARERFERMKLTVDAKDNRVTVRSREPRHDWHTWHRGMTLIARVRLPENFNLDLETSDGDIFIERINGIVEVKTSDGNVDLRSASGERVLIDTSDGDIRIGELDSPDIRIESSDGDISVDDLKGKEIDLRTSDGDIDVEAVSGGLHASTSDGEIRVGIERLAETTLRTKDGDIKIYASEKLKANLDLSGEDVALRRSSLSFDGEITEHSAHGKLNGGGPRLRATTGDGRIVLATRGQ